MFDAKSPKDILLSTTSRQGMTPMGRKRFFNFKENKEKQEEGDEFGRGRSNTITEHGVY